MRSKDGHGHGPNDELEVPVNEFRKAPQTKGSTGEEPSAATVGYLFPEQLLGAFWNEMQLLPSDEAIARAMHLVLTAGLGEHRRVGIVRDLLWSERDRRRAAYEMFRCLVLERDETLSDRWEPLLPLLLWIDPKFREAKREPAEPSLATFSRLVVRSGAFGMDPEVPDKKNMKRESSRENRSRLFSKKQTTNLGFKVVENAVVKDRADIVRRVRLTKLVYGQLEAFAHPHPERLVLAQAIMGLLIPDAREEPLSWRRLSPLASARADALSAFALAAEHCGLEPDSSEETAAILIQVLGRIDPRFYAASTKTVIAALTAVETAPAGPGGLQPSSGLTEVIMSLAVRPLGLVGKAQQVKHSLSEGGRVDEE